VNGGKYISSGVSFQGLKVLEAKDGITVNLSFGE
jgi:hypothetical protein